MYSKGHITMGTNRRRVAAQHMPTCLASLPYLKGCKHDILLPDRAEGLPHPNGCLHCLQTYFAACVHSSCQEKTAQQGRQERISLPRALLSRQGSLATASAASLRYIHAHQQNTTHFFLVQNLHNDRIIRYNYRNSEVGECEQRRLTNKTVRYERVQPLIYY